MGERKISVGLSLRLAREKYGYNGKILAEKLGMTAPAYRRYERDEVDPTTQTIINLSKIYGCSIDSLLTKGGEDPQGAGALLPKVNFEIEEGQTIEIRINRQGKTLVDPKETYKPDFMDGDKLPRKSKTRKKSA